MLTIAYDATVIEVERARLAALEGTGDVAGYPMVSILFVPGFLEFAFSVCLSLHEFLFRTFD